MRVNLSIAFILIFVFAGCRREFKTPSWETNLNAPLLYSDLGIEDLIPDSLLVVNPDNSVNLVFDETIFSFGIDSLLGLSDSTLKDSFISPLDSPIIPGATIFTNIDNNELNINDVELTKINLKQGFIDYRLTSNVKHPTIVTYSITNATIGAIPLELIVNIPAGTPAVPAVVTGTFSLAGANLDLTGISFDTYNSYQTKFVVKYATGVSADSLEFLVSKVTFRADFRDMIPSYILGYFGNLINETSLQSQTFNFPTNLNAATLDLSQVNTKFYVSNGLGADASFHIDTLMAYKSSTGSSVLLNHTMIGQNVNINRAIDMGWYAQPSKYEVDINSSNSNIESFIELLPDVVKYKIGVELNPLGNISGHTDFIYENSRVEAGLSVNIPLNLIASQIKLSDTLAFKLDDYDLNGKLLRGRMRLNVVNGLPLKATLKVQMLDENNMVIGNLISSKVINGNTTSTSTSTGADNYQTIYVDLDDDNIITAYRATKLVIYTEFETAPSGTFVSIYSTQRFKTQISIIADYLTHE